MITIKQRGNFHKTEKFLTRAEKFQYKRVLDSYGQEGVNALAMATPVDSGTTANSWGYTISISKSSSSIFWTNSHREGGSPVAILIQYGHGTRNGGFVEGVDYINPALRPIFDRIADQAWKELTSL